MQTDMLKIIWKPQCTLLL